MLMLTSPHSQCISQVRIRHCDSLAKLAADIFIHEAQQREISSKYFEGDTYRYMGDINRSESTFSQFRQRIRDWIETQPRNELIYAFDVHSFPYGYYSCCNPIYLDFFIIDVTTQKDEPFDPIAIKLVDTLRKNGFRASIFHSGSREETNINANDIIYELKSYSLVRPIYPFLFEFSENLTKNDLIKICQVILDTLFLSNWSEPSLSEEQIHQLARSVDYELDRIYKYGLSVGTPGWESTFGGSGNIASVTRGKDIIAQGITDIEEISAAVHQGWTYNFLIRYLYGIDDYSSNIEKLRNRLRLAIPYDQLTEDEKEKDRVVARVLIRSSVIPP